MSGRLYQRMLEHNGEPVHDRTLDFGEITSAHPRMSLLERFEHSQREMRSAVSFLLQQNLRPLAVFGVAVLAPVGVLLGLFASPALTVRSLVVNQATDREFTSTLEKLERVRGARLLFLSLHQVQEEITANPWVRSVNVRRLLPGTLSVQWEKREPVAVLNGYLVDAEGMVLAAAPHYGGEDLPRILVTDLREDTLDPGQRLSSEKVLLALREVSDERAVTPDAFRNYRVMTYSQSAGWLTAWKSLLPESNSVYSAATTARTPNRTTSTPDQE